MIKVIIKGKALSFTPDEAKEVGSQLLFLGVTAPYLEPTRPRPRKKKRKA